MKHDKKSADGRSAHHEDAHAALERVAGYFFDQGDHVNSWLIYEFLQGDQKKFEPKIEEIRHALRQHSEHGAKLAEKVKVHSDLATETQKRLRIAHIISEKGDESLAREAFSGHKLPPESWLALANAIANGSKPGWWGVWLRYVNKYLALYELPPVQLRPKKLRQKSILYMNLEPSSSTEVKGPLVTVFMACFNAQETVENAIRSILSQSYTNFELLVIDDCSTDSTVDIVRRIAAEDSRIRLIENTENQGAYVNRNRALQQARGEFFTVHDSDDFALPHRLAWAVQHLEKNPAHIGVVGQWLRLDENGKFLFKSGWGGVYLHIAVVTLTLRTQQARDTVGYWDSVRFAADTEYFERLKLVFGAENVPVVPMPLALALFHANSLTSHPEHGIDVNNKEGWSPVRSQYAKAWQKWHAEYKKSKAGNSGAQGVSAPLHLPFPLVGRPFDVPEALIAAPAHAAKRDEAVDSNLMRHLFKGNTFWRNGELAKALQEYRNIPAGSRLFRHAKFNAEFVENLMNSKGRRQTGERFALKNRDKEPQSLLSSSGGLNDVPSSGKPLLSIIMPVFNVAPYLDTAIVSALNQRGGDLELIIINDASTDGSRKIIDMHASQDSRIRAVHLEHNTLGGAGIPSNIGIRMARGEYIGFIDSDDWALGDAFSSLLECAKKHDADIVIGDFRTFTEDDRAVSPSYDKGRYAGPYDQLVNAATAPSLLRLSAVPWRKLYKRAYMQKNAIEYPEGDYFYEDNPLHWFVLSRAERVVVVDKCISYHRMGREGQTMTSNAYKLSAMCSHVNSIFNFLNSQPESLVDRKIIWEEFWTFWRGAQWILKNQSQSCAENLIKKRFSQIAERIQSVAAPPSSLQPELERNKNAYPDIDLTVVIPVFNAAGTIGGTLDSVLAIQGIRYNILLVDDGSSDNSLEVIQAYEKDHPHVHVFQQGNRGAGRARNSLIPLCTGSYTYFLDADDTINAEALCSAVKQAMKGGNDLLFFKYKIDFVDEKKSRGMFESDSKLWNSLPKAKSQEERRAIFCSLINYPWNRIIKTSLLHDANIFFGPTIVHNDIPFHWLSIMSAENIDYVNVDVCSHKKFKARPQITNLMDDRRLGLFEALRFSEERLLGCQGFPKIKNKWEHFSENLLVWAREKISPDLHKRFDELKTNMTSG
ncbi:MAG: glycosyltransferase [Azoarcus sp.]|jgi:glycosyltransferase involved in cell wall biosynthesis|nr:glycosyltransferase [Azoarcus sp.]